MGFLDKKGVKKLVDWIKDKINNISIPETGQPIWTYVGMPHGDNIYLHTYEIHEIYGCSYNVEIYFDLSEIPDQYNEYKLRSKGKYLNYINWPSVFDVPWPNNEIPVFEEDKKYEIYIAGGRVVSVSDVTPLIEEVSYTVTTTEGHSYIRVTTDGTLVDYYVDGEFVERNWSYEKNTFDSNFTFTYTVKGDLSTINKISTQGLQYIKVDCSKMKSNNFDKVTNGLKIDEIIYPQACVGDIYGPTYDFEAPDLDFTFLAKNNMLTPCFGDLISNKNLNKIINLSSFGECSSKNFESRNIPYTIGSLNEGVKNFLYTSAGVRPKYVGYALGDYSDNVTIASEEFSAIITTSEPVVFFGIVPLFGYVSTLDENISFEGVTSGKIYYGNNINFDTSLYPDIEFIQVDSFYDIPFKYAAYNIGEVKNFDENGNVIV